MAYTEFVRQIQSQPNQMTWKDILSEYHMPHSKKDMDYTLMAGSSLLKYDEASMFQQWRKPWLFWRVLIIGLIAIAGVYLAEFLIIALYDYCSFSAINLLFIIVPPMVTPIALMIFFWELNVPRNISIYQLFGCFAGGGLMSILFTAIFGAFTGEVPAYYAPLTEEPAKLLVSMLVINLVARRSGIKVYGLTGLCIGAAIGAGFGAFESAHYAFNAVQEVEAGLGIGLFMTGNVLWKVVFPSHLIRGILAVGGHTLYCAPYAAAAALNQKNGRITFESLLNQQFLITFGISCLIHFLWNGGGGILTFPASLVYGSGLEYVMLYAVYALLCVAVWANTLWITRTCLQQAAAQQYRSAASAPYPQARSTYGQALIIHVFVNGRSPSRVSLRPGTMTYTVGRDPGCSVPFPGAAGISRFHCTFVCRNGRWYVRDENSRYGTLLANGTRLSPKNWYPVQDGMCLYLGGRQNALALAFRQ